MKRFYLLALFLGVAGVTSGCVSSLSGQKFETIQYPYPAGQGIWSKRAKAKIYFTQLGKVIPNKSSIVLIHPWGGNMIIWKDLTEKLSQDFHLVLLDLPGHGKSSKPIGRYPPKRMAGATLDVIDALGLKQPILIGNSLGGATTIETALLSPKKIKAIGLLGAPGGSQHPRVIGNFVSSFVHSKNVASISPAMAHFMWWLIAQTSNPLSKETVDTTWVHPRKTKQWPLFARAMSESLGELLVWDPPIEKISVPTLVVQGQTDIVVWPWLGSALAKRIKDSEYRPLNYCGHFPQLQCLEKLMKVLKPFLKKYANSKID